MSINFTQFKEKDSWWHIVVFYFIASLFVSVLFCYLIFSAKIYFQKRAIAKSEEALLTIGTNQQKDNESKIFDYRNKINDFSKFIKDHKISSNIFVFLEQQTLPNVWFNKFDMTQKNSELVIEGETENMESLSRQTTIFEKSEHISKVNILSSNIGESGKIIFKMSLSLSPEIFNFYQILNQNNESANQNNQINIAP